MQLLEKHIVEELENKVRFQEYGVGIFNTIPTKSAIKKAIQSRCILPTLIATLTSQNISLAKISVI